MRDLHNAGIDVFGLLAFERTKLEYLWTKMKLGWRVPINGLLGMHDTNIWCVWCTFLCVQGACTWFWTNNSNHCAIRNPSAADWEWATQVFGLYYLECTPWDQLPTASTGEQ